MITVHVIVTPKRSVLDPQGEAVRKAIESLGLQKLHHVRVGKFIELELDVTPAAFESSRKKLEEIAQDLLSNPVIEDYRLEPLFPVATAPVAPTKSIPTRSVRKPTSALPKTPTRADYEGLSEAGSESSVELTRLEIKPKKAAKKILKIALKKSKKDEDPKAGKSKMAKGGKKSKNREIRDFSDLKPKKKKKSAVAE